MRRVILIVCGLIFFLTGGFCLERTSWFVPLKQALQSQSVPVALLRYGSLGDIMRKLSLVKTIPNDYSQFPVSKKREGKVEKTIETLLEDAGKRQCDKALMYFHIYTNVNARLQIYWADKNQIYSEKRSASIHIKREKNKYELFIEDIKSIQRLRLDMSDRPSEILIKGIYICQVGYETISFLNQDEFTHLTPLNDISEVTINQEGCRIVSSGNDPQLEIYIEPKYKNIGTVLFPKKRQTGEYLYRANAGGIKDLPSSLVIHENNFVDGWPLLSIVTDKKNLYDPEIGILSNYEGHGSKWERLAYVSYYENEELLFGTSVGLRLHGGKSRYRVKEFKSLRLYFRNEYGANQFKPGVLFGPETEPLKRLVVHHMGWPLGWPFNNVLAYDISRRIGCAAPVTKMVVLYLNGRFQGMHFLTPHQSKKQLESYFGHSNFGFYRSKSFKDHEDRKFFRRDFWRTTNSREKLTMKEVGKSIDLDNLSRWIFSIVFCGASDYHQGTAVRDYTDPDSKLFWFIWDMDQSFIDVSKEIFRKKTKRKIWEQSHWHLVFRERHYDGRTKLFSRLMNEDPAYRKYFITLVMDILNHRINSEYLKSRLDYYKKALISYGEKNSDYFKKLDLFFEHRADFLRKTMKKYFGVGESIPCNVKGPVDIKYEIDGYPENHDYHGWYLKGSSIKLEIVSPHRKIFSHWLVNGEKVSDVPLVYPVDSEAVIEPILEEDN